MEVIIVTFLYEVYNNASEGGFKDFKNEIPEYISSNLRHPLRPYQKEAIGRYLYYKNDEKNRVLPEQILYNMATGSGKTLLMAAIILEKYKQGERNFIFFVNNSNILTKTRDNFLGGIGSSKYLFTDKIVIDNQVVNIREVSDFSDSQKDSINIIFTTIQQLHGDLTEIKENNLSYEQFEDLSVVLLADEAHHLNAGLNDKNENSWTNTIQNIQRSSEKSSLFEFTATIDLENKDIAKKYEKSLIYKYDLKAFRLDKYSKDVLFHLVDSDIETRMLQAIIISQLRKKIALKHGINLKPLVMFKSQKTGENKNNLTMFSEMLNSLNEENIIKQKQLINIQNGKNSILQKAFSYFEKENISNNDLIEELKEEFRAERLIIIDGKTKTSETLQKLNTLEKTENEVRAIFAVNMLDEGWDVLNLFDIVRLYDTRDGKTTKNGFKPGATTNSEKQLIGRGARYYPFVLDSIDEKYTRKFDNNEANELRVIEQLHYHSANNPKYISELKQVLRESGIYDDVALVERELKLKESFKKTRTYTHGVVWMNKRLSYSEYVQRQQQSLLDMVYIQKSYEVILPTQSITDLEVFSDEDVINISPRERINFKFNEISSNVVRHAINRNKNFTFNNLQKYFYGLASTEKFIEMLNDIDVTVESHYTDFKELTQDDKLYVIEEILKKIADGFIEVEDRYYGSDKFEPYPIKKMFSDKIIRKYTVNYAGDKETGISQKDKIETKYYENLDAIEWYAYDDNYGTSEEKLLVRVLKEVMEDLKENWTDIYLLRNEKAVRIYSFETGQAFEPDFLMFANDKKHGNTSWQIFIEPKGGQFTGDSKEFYDGKEAWKEKFLNEITRRDEARTLVDNSRFRIVGLPFFNEKISKEVVKEKLREINKDTVYRIDNTYAERLVVEDEAKEDYDL
jgi:type III site-specific deoxyribonuclease